MQQPGPPPPGGYNPMMQPGPPPPGGYNPNNMQPRMQQPPSNYMGPPPPGNMAPNAGPGMNPAGMYRPPVSGGPRPQYPGQMMAGQQRTGQALIRGPPPPSTSANQYGIKPLPGAGPPVGQMPVSTGQQSNYRTGPSPTSSGYQPGPAPPNGVAGPPAGPGPHASGPPSSRFSSNAHNRFAPSSGAMTNSFPNGSGGPPPTTNAPTQRLPNSGPPPSGTPPIGGSIPLPVAQVPPTIQQDRPSSAGDLNASLNSSGEFYFENLNCISRRCCKYETIGIRFHCVFPRRSESVQIAFQGEGIGKPKQFLQLCFEIFITLWGTLLREDFLFHPPTHTHAHTHLVIAQRMLCNAKNPASTAISPHP